MNKVCIVSNVEIIVKELIDIIKDIGEYDIYVLGETGLSLEIDKEEKIVNIESYIFNSKTYFLGEDYISCFDKSMVYYTMKVNEFIKMIKPFLQYKIRITSDRFGVMYIGNKKIDFWGSHWFQTDEDALEVMEEKKGYKYIHIEECSGCPCGC